jgi:N-acyl-phosphatidylethanolamine-hydrolysing phospholipase D
MALTRCVALLAAGIATLGANAFAADSAPIAGPHFAVTWIGGPTAVITFGSLTILTDPMLGEAFAMGDPNDPLDHETVRQHRRLTSISDVDLKSVDVVILSHGHEDHFDQRAQADLDHGLPIILPIADTATVEAKGFRKLDGLDWGETRQIEAGAGWISITAIAARHSQSPATAKALGKGNGYWIEFAEGGWRRTVYWTGDTMPTEEVINAVKARGKPDLMVAHVGGVGENGPFGQISMRAADVVSLAAAVHPNYVLPIHHTTYAFYREPIGALAEQSGGAPYRLDLISPGATVVYR